METNEATQPGITISGRMKVKTLKHDFFNEFGLNIRIYDGQRFADDEATLASIRKGDHKGGEFSPRRNTKVGNLEDKMMELFGLKVQISGSDDSYLCNDDLTIAGAYEADEKKIEKKAKKTNTNVVSGANSIRFEAKIKSASADNDFEAEELPVEFAQAKELWKAKDPKCFELLLGFIKCYFVKDNLSGDLDELFVLSEDEDSIEANELVFTSVDFSETNIPTFSAAAYFDFSVKKGVTKEVIDEWQDENDFLDSAISFEWQIPDLNVDEAITCWNHDGLSFNVIEE